MGLDQHGPHAGTGAPRTAPARRNPHGHWKTTTFVAGLRRDGIAAPFVLDGPINREAFEAYIARVLVPELRPGDVVIMDNLSSHKGPRVRELIEAAGASLRYLPPYSPDFNPIENAFAKLKALLRKPPSAPSAPFGTGSQPSSTPSRLANAPTTSQPQVTMQAERIRL